MGTLISLIVGCAIGWAAGYFWKGSGYGLVGNLALGLLGGALGNIVFSLLSITIVRSLAGAFFILFLASKYELSQQDEVREEPSNRPPL